VIDNLQIYHVNVNCTDFERSLAFYKMIGFREHMDLGEGGVDGLGFGDCNMRAMLLSLGDDPRATVLDLIEWTDPKTDGAPYAHLAHTGIGRICVRVKDLGAVYDELVGKGVEFLSEPVEANLGGGHQKFVCLKDPDGTILEFMEFIKD
jgi:catechol 2,3-dioxygenase-like lactoylglutathione lyase family enzyme